MNSPKIGDIVELNSGSLPMTITAVLDNDVKVEWDNEDILCSRWIPVVCVKLFDLKMYNKP